MSTAGEISPTELYHQLRRREETLTKENFARMRVVAAKLRFFHFPLFARSGEKPTKASQNRTERLGDAEKYAVMLAWLRKCGTSEDRLFILANWLYQEGICEPEDLLGQQGFQPYVTKALAGLSLTDFRQAAIVDTWRPYFEKLLVARKKLAGSKAKLLQMGFDNGAIEATLRKRKPIPAACEWLSVRLAVEPTALVNAYSRVFSEVRRLHPELFQVQASQ
jgi:hypothetical protein